MFKRFIACLLAAAASLAFAATDINKASPAELQTVRGIGASTAEKIVAERQKGEFKDWADVVGRVSGVGPKSAAKLSAAGLTVNGASLSESAAEGLSSGSASSKQSGKGKEKSEDKARKVDSAPKQ